MRDVLVDILVVVWSAVVGLYRALTGKRRQRYASTALVAAPRETVWEIINARQITFDGIVPIEIDVGDPDPETHVSAGVIRMGDRQLRFAYRVLEERPQEALMIELLADGCDREVRPGDDYIAVVELADAPGGTLMTVIHELTHKRFRDRLAVPLGIRLNARRIRRKAEQIAGTAASEAGTAVRDALLTGALTTASFAYLFGVEIAIILVVLLLIHELGHVIAMRWLGMAVRGIYFVPFMGAVAVGADRYRNQGERGLVALMGPAFSLLPTAAFYVAYLATGTDLTSTLALTSAFLNGFNLLPMLPLDGGQIVAALASRHDEEVGRLVNLTGVVAGVALSVALEWYLLTGLLLLVLPAVFSRKPALVAIAPITGFEAALLALASLATAVFYGAVVHALY
jgi:Zn-dependent protease